MDQDALERLHLVHARLLYIISEMYSEQKINEHQKAKLKVRVFKDDQEIFDTYQTYKDDLYLFQAQLISIVPPSPNVNAAKPHQLKRPGEEENKQKEALVIQSSPGSELDDINSPMDAALTKKKKALQKAHEKQAAAAGGMRIDTKNTTATSTNLTMANCEDGMSPQLTKFTAPKKK